MNFWQRIVASSSLSTGTVWELLSNPKPTVVQPPNNTFSGTIISDGIDINIETEQFTVELQENNMEIFITQNSIEIYITEEPIEISISTEL